MKVLLDENNYIIGYAVVGDIMDSLDVDFEEKDFNMLPCFLYKYDGKEIILDEEKKKQWEEEQNGIEAEEPNAEQSSQGYVTYEELANAIKEGVNTYGL